MAAPESYNTGTRPFQRATAMRQNGGVYNPTATSQNNFTDQKNEADENQDLLENKVLNNNKILRSFSKTNGMPFLFKNNNEPASNNGTSLTNRSVFHDNNNGNNDDGDVTNKPAFPNSIAADRFRSAGLKARLASRMEKIVEDRMTIKQIFNRYVDNSTLHGFRFIFMKTFVARRFLWLALTVAMAALFFSELRNSIKLFYQYPFTTLSTTEFVANLKFPAISICNLNSFDVNKIKMSKLNKIYEREQFPFTGEDFELGYDLTGDELIASLKYSSQGIADIFQSCEWKSRDTAKTGKANLCGSFNFTRYSNMESQECFTFNGGDVTDVLTLNETGLNMAFKLELDLRANKSLSNLEEVGVKLIIHDQSETPLHHAGFVVSPGFQTFVEMKVKKTENLQPPYATKCGEKPLKYSHTYRQSHCFMEQLNDAVIKNCKCRGEFMKDATSVPYCTLKQTVQCLMPTVHHFDRKTSPECPVDCNSVQYTTALSYARFLSNPAHGMESLQDATSSYINELKTQMDSEQLRKYIEENIVTVQVFYQEMKEENIKQEPSYDFYKLVGDVGGQLGLMLGASVLTLVEFVDLFFFALYHQLLRLSRRNKKQQNGKI